MKKIIITGASGGIGLETARMLADKDYQVTLVARNEEKLNKALKTLKGNQHAIFVSDLTNDADIQKLAAHLRTENYDVLINNAGGGIYGRFVEIQLQDQLDRMHLNMDTLVTLSYAYLQNAKPGDTLINIGSQIAHSSLPGSSVYAATKSFVANFSESLWYEFKEKGIRVFGFHPGAASSDFHNNAGGQTSDFPDFVMSSVADVAEQLVNALENANKPRIVQGWKNRLMLFGFRFLSRKTAVNIMGGVSPGMKN